MSASTSPSTATITRDSATAHGQRCRRAARCRRPTTRSARPCGVDLVAEQHEAGVVELVLGHVDVDPGHVAHREAVGAVDGAAELGVDALRLEAGRSTWARNAPPTEVRKVSRPAGIHGRW